MTLINLYGPTVDKRDHYRDAGEDLLVGDAEGDDITEEAAQVLVDMRRAVDISEDAEGA